MDEELYMPGQGQAEGSSCEIPERDYERRAVAIIAKHVAKSLDIAWGSRDIVGRLLKTSLDRFLAKRGGILEQYLHSQLDIIVDEVCRRENIEASTNYKNATHAKLNGLFAALKVQQEQS